MRLLALIAAAVIAATAYVTGANASACHGGGGMSQGSDTRCR